MKVATKSLLEEQIAAVVVPGRGEKNDAMWHVPSLLWVFLRKEVNVLINVQHESVRLPADPSIAGPVGLFRGRRCRRCQRCRSCRRCRRYCWCMVVQRCRRCR